VHLCNLGKLICAIPVILVKNTNSVLVLVGWIGSYTQMTEVTTKDTANTTIVANIVMRRSGAIIVKLSITIYKPQ
jgi:hypothetical protein